MAVNELFSRLCFNDVWQERPGGLTADEAVVLANQMMWDYLESDGYCMIGAIVPVMRETLPPNMLLCDGDTYLREDYPELYAVLDPAFIDDADHFVTPNLSGRVVIGEHTDFPVDAAGGERVHSLTTGEIPSHTHTQNSHGHTGNSHGHSTVDTGHVHPMPHTHPLTLRNNSTAGSNAFAMAAGSAVSTGAENTGASSASDTSSATTGISINNSVISVQDATATNQNTGGGGSHNNMQPYRALKYAVIAK